MKNMVRFTHIYQTDGENSLLINPLRSSTVAILSLVLKHFKDSIIITQIFVENFLYVENCVIYF